MRPHRRKRVVVLLLVVGAIALLVFEGCGLIALRYGTFNHAVHLAQKIDCDACHHEDSSPSEVGMPKYRTCLPCHGPSTIRDAYPYETKIQQQDPDGGFHVRPRTPDLKFSHENHYLQGVECSQCHVDLDPGLLSGPAIPGPDTCQECHQPRGVGSECSVCHDELRRDAAPPSHRPGTWIRSHGRAAALGPPNGHEESCRLCHEQSSCDGCHRMERPADHSEFFRLRGHGLQVSIRRERCATCHEESSCVRCHNEVRPRSHSGLWGGTRSNHCLRCHDGSFGETSCSVCHQGQGATSHQQASAVPPPPHPGSSSDCRVCHLRPPHADNGMSCGYCHR